MNAVCKLLVHLQRLYVWGWVCLCSDLCQCVCLWFQGLDISKCLVSASQQRDKAEQALLLPSKPTGKQGGGGGPGGWQRRWER